MKDLQIVFFLASLPNGRYIENMNKNRKTLLIEKITTLFAEQGYASLGVSAIASKCDISKPTLYYYFESKENLLAAIIDYYGSSLRQKLAIDSTSEQPETILFKIVDAFLKFVSDNPSYFRLYLSLVFTPHENRAYQIVKAEAEAIQQIVESVLSVSTKNKATIPMLAVSLIGQMNSFATIVINGYLTYTPELAKQVIKLYMHGAEKYGQSE